MTKLKRIYILRHGEAEPYTYEHDALRELTDFGQSEIRSTAQSFLKHGEMFDAVFVSPYTRAQQTARIFLSEIASLVTPQVSSIITPSGNAFDVALWMNDQPYDSILIVTHQPFAHELVDLLADEPLPSQFAMVTGNLAALEGEMFAAACCQYKWAITP